MYTPYKSNTEKFFSWLSNLLCFTIRFLAGGALAGLFIWAVANKILWEYNLPTMPYWWYWFLFVTIFILRMLMKKGAFDDDNN